MTAAPGASQPIFGAGYGDWIAGGFYKRKPIFSNYLFIGEITILSAPGGSAKSTWAILVAASLASGQPLFGVQIKQRRVLYVDLEDNGGAVALSFYAAEKHFRLSRNDLSDHLHIVGARAAQQFVLTEPDGRGGHHIHKAGFAALLRHVQQFKAELVILDPLVLIAEWRTER